MKKIGRDHYDKSIELYEADDELRLDETAQRHIYGNGFAKAYVNHKNTWETHYSWGPEFSAQKGWRRKRTANGFEINYRPESWNTPKILEWLKSGYMKIVGGT